jgi:hypothetical protein
MCTLWKLWKWMKRYVPHDVLEEAIVAKYQMLPTKSKLR